MNKAKITAKEQQSMDRLREQARKHGDAEGTEAELGDVDAALQLAFEMLPRARRTLFLKFWAEDQKEVA